MRNWWARVALHHGEYGSWIITPETDLEMAKFYLARIRGHEGHVVEWLQL